VSVHDQTELFDSLLTNLRAALEKWYSGDTSGYSGLYADEFTYFDPFGRDRLHNPAELRERHAPLDGTLDIPRFELVDPTLQMFGETAVLSFHLRTFDHDGPIGPTWNTTEVYRPIDGAWRIVHGHWSVMAEDEA